MTDADLQAAERRFRATGHVVDEAAWLRARARAGRLAAGALPLAAWIGHAAARLTLGDDAPPAPAPAAWLDVHAVALRSWAEGVAGLGLAAARQVAFAAARRAARATNDPVTLAAVDAAASAPLDLRPLNDLAEAFVTESHDDALFRVGQLVHAVAAERPPPAGSSWAWTRLEAPFGAPDDPASEAVLATFAAWTLVPGVDATPLDLASPGDVASALVVAFASAAHAAGGPAATLEAVRDEVAARALAADRPQP